MPRFFQDSCQEHMVSWRWYGVHSAAEQIVMHGGSWHSSSRISMVMQCLWLQKAGNSSPQRTLHKTEVDGVFTTRDIAANYRIVKRSMIYIESCRPRCLGWLSYSLNLQEWSRMGKNVQEFWEWKPILCSLSVSARTVEALRSLSLLVVC